MTVLDVIAEDPEAVEPFLVWADELQAAGDPRGEWIAISHARMIAATDDARAEFWLREHDLIVANEEAWWPPIPIRRALVVRWRLGSIYAARIETIIQLRAVAAIPFATSTLVELHQRSVQQLRDTHEFVQRLRGLRRNTTGSTPQASPIVGEATLDHAIAFCESVETNLLDARAELFLSMASGLDGAPPAIAEQWAWRAKLAARWVGDGQREETALAIATRARHRRTGK